MVAEILRLLPHFTEDFIRMLLFFVLLKTKEKKYLMKIILFIFLVCVDTVFTEIITTIKTLDNYSAFILLTGRFFLADYFFAGTLFERLTKVILIDMVKYLCFACMPTSLSERIAFLLIGLIVCLLFRKTERFCSKEDWFWGAMLFLGSFICTNITSKFLLLLSMLIFDIAVFSYILKIIREREDNNMFNAFIEKMNDELSNALEHENSNEKLRALRHEIRNEYVPIKEMLANGDYESARKLLDEFSGDWERSLVTYNTVNSGNKMIDSVFNYFIRKYSENGYNADFMIERCDIDQSMEKDICQIQINLLKNAFEAAGKTSEKTVRVMMFTEKNYLKIRVLNSVSGNVADALKNVQNEHTTKADLENHGFGIPAVKTKLRLLHGYFMCFEEDGLFGCEMGVSAGMGS